MRYLFLVLGFCFTLKGFSQRCIVSPAVSNSFNARKGSIGGSRDTLPNEVITVPVVVHILYNTSAQNIPDQHVIDQINSLNKDFRRMNADTVNTPESFKKVAADSRIVFCLAKTDPNGKSTTGIIRKYTKEKLFMADDQMKFSSKGGDDAWDPAHYYNIWVCNLFGRVLGYGVMPGGQPALDGTVIQYQVFGSGKYISGPYNLGRTLTHETGHWLGLKHLWGDTFCGSDDIDDTPPQETSNSGCPQFPHKSSCSINSYGDMFMNYMDFTNDACMNLFTQGQAKEMRSQFARNGFRNLFLNSTACQPSQIEAGPTVPDDDDSAVDIRVYPNPFSEQLFVSGKSFDNVNGKYIRIYNIQGKKIKEIQLHSQTTQIDMSQLPSGIYLALFEDVNQRKIFKLIKTGSAY